MLVVFDLDDTLYLEADFVESGFRAVDEHLRTAGTTGFHPIAWKLFQSGARGTIFDQTLAQLGHPATPTLVRELVDVYRSHAGQLRLTEDSAICLSAIEGHADLGLITDGPSVAQWNKLRMLGLLDTFGGIVVTDDLGPGAGKPSPVAFRKLQGDRSGAACVYIGDNPRKDFQAPKELGWRTIRIRRPRGLYSGQPDDPGAIAEVHLPDLGQVPLILSRWEHSPSATCS